MTVDRQQPAPPAGPDQRGTRAEADRAFAALHARWCADRADPGLRSELTALARSGHAPAACALARLLFEGQPQDAAGAFGWALRAAHGGFAAASAMVGDFYLHAEPEHRSCVRLVERALPWHEQAARAGHAQAALATSDSYRMGRGCDRDFERAYCYLLLAIGRRDRPLPVAELLLPSLRTDLEQARMAAIEAQAAALLAEEPAADADLDRFWSLQAAASA